MRSTPKALFTALLAATLLVGACGGGDDAIAGSYSCVEPEPPPDAPALPDMPPAPLELRDDQTFILENPTETIEGTWVAEGNSGTLTFPGGEEVQFTVEGDRIVLPDGRECTKV